MATMNESGEIEIVIGQYADYFDTGIWTFQDGELIAPEDITASQLRDFLIASGGFVYLRKDRRFGWINGDYE